MNEPNWPLRIVVAALALTALANLIWGALRAFHL